MLACSWVLAWLVSLPGQDALPSPVCPVHALQSLEVIPTGSDPNWKRPQLEVTPTATCIVACVLTFECLLCNALDLLVSH